MLLHIQEVKGKLSNKFIKKGRFTDMHFDESGAFLSSELNKTTGTVRPMHALADQAYAMTGCAGKCQEAHFISKASVRYPISHHDTCAGQETVR